MCFLDKLKASQLCFLPDTTIMSEEEWALFHDLFELHNADCKEEHLGSHSRLFFKHHLSPRCIS
ncbi:mCG1025824 [Mus musculus]|nr:mCG1025824 [Mus musculus]